MFKKSALLTFLFLCSLALFANPKDSLRVEARNGNKFFVHKVVKQESLASLAERYGVDASQILSNNPLVSDKVFPGQIIRIPVNESKYGDVPVTPVVPLTDSKLPLAKSLPAPTPLNGKGSSPSQEPETPVETKIEVPDSKLAEVKTTEAPPVAAPTVAANTTQEKPATSEKKFQVYVVVTPQTVQHLSESFAVDANEVIALNNLKNYNLKEGQKVKIPVSHAPAEEPKPAVVASAPVVQPKVEEVPKSAPVVAAAPPKLPTETAPRPSPLPQIAKVEPKPEPKIEPKIEPKPEPKPEPKVIAKAEPNPIQTPPVAVAQQDAPVKPKPSPLAARTAQVASKESDAQEDADSAMMAVIKRERKAKIMALDSTYIVPEGVTYKVFDYKKTDYQFDVFTLQMAEENAIDVNTVNQRKGTGDKNFTHVVKRGETIQSIAKKYRISATDIINWNGLLTYRVREGMELVVNSARADISPYERTMIKPAAATTVEPQARWKTAKGLCRYDFKKQAKGVYMNGVEKGKFVYIIHAENFQEHFARVLGPLPKNTPEGVVLIIDRETAKALDTDLSLFQVEIYYSVFTEGVSSNK